MGKGATRLWGLGLLVLAVPLLLYVPLIQDHGYVWDDWLLFVNDAALRSTDRLWERVLEPVLWNSSYLRPLVMASFGGELILFGNDPLWPHLFNVGLHTLNTTLVFCIGVGLRRSQTAAVWPAALAALVYALHPALVESTAWIAGRFDLMVSSFMLAALALLLHTRGWVRDIAVALCFGLALLCKEMAITLPGLIVALLIWHGPQGETLLQGLKRLAGPPFWRLWTLLVLTILAYFLFRWSVLGSVTGPLRSVNNDLGPMHRVALTGWALIFYLRGTWLPFFNAAPVYPIHAAKFDAIDLALGGVTALGVGLLVIWLVMRRPRHVLSMGVAIWCLALLPVLHLVPLPFENVGHDRFLTFPLALWALMLTRLESTTSQGHVRWLRVLLLPLLLWVLAAVVSVRNSAPIWANDLALWSWAHEKNPSSREVNNNLLAAANRYGKLDLSKSLIEANVAGGMPEFEVNKAGYHMRKGDPKEALSILEQLERERGSPHLDLSQPESYLDTFRAPQNTFQAVPVLYSSKAEAYFMLEEYALALRMSRVALLYHPGAPVALRFRALSLYGLQRWQEADTAFEEAQRRDVKGQSSPLTAMRQNLLDKICAKTAEAAACSRATETTAR